MSGRLDHAAPVSLTGQASVHASRVASRELALALDPASLHVDEDGCLAGRNPMDVPVAVLSASGHPHPDGFHQVSLGMGWLLGGIVQPVLALKGGYASTVWPVRKRAGPNRPPLSNFSYNCPCWPYRMGVVNPHDERRGKTPVFRAPHRTEQAGLGGGAGDAAAKGRGAGKAR